MTDDVSSAVAAAKEEEANDDDEPGCSMREAPMLLTSFAMA